MTTQPRFTSEASSVMNETLFSQIQRLFERTYAQVGINLEDCLIDHRPLRAIVAAGGRDRAGTERTRAHFPAAGRRSALCRHLLFALAYRTTRAARSAGRIERPQHPVVDRVCGRDQPRPSCGTAVQERASARSPRKISRGTSSSRRGSILISSCSCSSPSFGRRQKVSRTDRRWLRFHLFAAENPGAFQSTNLRSRYLETTELAARYTEFLDTLNAMRRLEEIRAFRCS